MRSWMNGLEDIEAARPGRDESDEDEELLEDDDPEDDESIEDDEDLDMEDDTDGSPTR